MGCVLYNAAMYVAIAGKMDKGCAADLYTDKLSQDLQKCVSELQDLVIACVEARANAASM